ncbi:polycystin cation channel family [Raphidocelis subcapitata]|uniref:Polycystin cation channel family n=1 Tax=Raphidocelis subcapitata TaxID=307507 RepID=A0A2V0PDE7_9CHLO|nr:polycystin cation channel family [Raphidocelis subcapitata]|eukprot:GBF96992.1 polycystin cation channel family [Raphidocelis subcapitata]
MGPAGEKGTSKMSLHVRAWGDSIDEQMRGGQRTASRTAVRQRQPARHPPSPAKPGDPKLTYSQHVVRAIHAKWEAQMRRAAGYRRLAVLVAFIALLLGVLYAQRGAAAAFRVHSTLDSVLAPPQGSALMSADDVYGWLEGVLRAVWRDPVCGDGLCETPFEFASYGRFGCRADCGSLIDLQALASLDIDLYWDFAHQPGSLPAAELMSQASWNLCPQKIQYDSSCYYGDDVTFDSISGATHVTLPDVPDGVWALRVKRDLMSKVRGAVRSTSGVARAAVWFKIYIAATAVAAEQAFELSLLNTALDAARTPLLDYLPTLWNITRAGRDAFDAQQMREGTCLCAGGAAPLAGTAGFVDEAAHRTGSACAGVTQFSQRAWTINGTVLSSTPYPDAAACAEALSNLTTHRTAFNATLLGWLVSQRLGNQATTGKIANRTAAVSVLRAFLASNYPELVAPVFTAPKGADALGDPGAATLAALTNLYVDAPSFAAAGPPAHLALFRRRLMSDPGATAVEWGNRAAARIAEIGAQQAEVSALALPVDSAIPATVGSLAAAFRVSGANATWLPPASAGGLGAFGEPYNLASWRGGQYEFVSCELPRRGADYVGTCEPKAVRCGASAVDGVPYACTRVADGTAVPGNLSVSSYRDECEAPCDLELDCGALCDCGVDGCAVGQICTCTACRQLRGDASADGEFTTVAAAATSSGALAALFAPMAAAGGRRRLMAATNDDVLAALAGVSSKVGTLRAAQDAISGQVDALRGKVDQANLLAEARAANTRLQDLITAGRADIATGQRSLESRLDELLQRQAAALDAARSAAAALAAVQGLAERQVAALSGLDAAVKEQVRTIAVAAQQGLISLSTALSYWKVARRNRAAEAKVYRLANTPCGSASVTDHAFAIDNGNPAVNGTARDRSVGLNNRINTCRAAGAPDVTSFGVDPAFKPGAASYQPDLAAADDAPMLARYDCGGLPAGTAQYDAPDPATGLVGNPRPYCAQLFNPRNVPWGFHHFPLPGAPPGFPVWIDINLSQGGALTWLAWLRDGLMLDESTRALTARAVTYNPDLKIFAAAAVDFDFGAGGAITARSRVSSLRMEPYAKGSKADAARLAAEIALTAAAGLMAAGQLWAVARAARRGGLARYFSSPAHWVDTVSNALLIVCCSLWWLFVTRHARVWSMELRYDVYADLQPTANFLKLFGDGRGLTAAWAAIRGLEAGADLLAWYFALSAISILLLLARLLRRMDFQPRLGVITRSLRRALPDLLHFALVAGAVFLGYAVTGYLLLGNSVPQFAGLGAAVNTCFAMMLGEFGDVWAALGQLDGGVAAALFFWTFMLLVFLVLLNFLLAIIVDAFAEVKERTHESTGIHTELARLAADYWRAVASRLPGGPPRAGRAKLEALLRGWGGGGGGGGRRESSESAPAGGESEGEEGGAGGAAGGGEGAGEGPWDERGGGGGGGGSGSGARTLRVLGQELDEPSLARVLAEALAPFDAADAGAPKPGAAGAAAAAEAGGAAAAGEEEAAALARFVLQRYGTAAGRAARSEGDSEPGGGDTAPADPRAALEAERDRLASALEQLAGVQRELAEAQRELMAGQKQLAEQQARLLEGER